MPDPDEPLPEPEEVGGDVTGQHTGKIKFDAKQSTAQMPRKSRGTCRLVVHHHFEFSDAELKELGQAHGRNYIDGVDYGRALLAWVQAEGQHVENYIPAAVEYADRFTLEVSK